jgi:hypothetical protein
MVVLPVLTMSLFMRLLGLRYVALWWRQQKRFSSWRSLVRCPDMNYGSGRGMFWKAKIHRGSSWPGWSLLVLGVSDTVQYSKFPCWFLIRHCKVAVNHGGKMLMTFLIWLSRDLWTTATNLASWLKKDYADANGTVAKKMELLQFQPPRASIQGDWNKGYTAYWYGHIND